MLLLSHMLTCKKERHNITIDHRLWCMFCLSIFKRFEKLRSEVFVASVLSKNTQFLSPEVPVSRAFQEAPGGSKTCSCH